MVKKSISGVGDPTIPFISDCCKGLLATMRDVFLKKVHGHYANHLKANVKKSFGKASAKFFMSYVYTNSRVK